jgi:transitional endoplasmic reticulum ATPase
VDQNLIIQQGKQFIFPEGIEIRDGVKTVIEWLDYMETPTDFVNTFEFRPWDGANAFAQALIKKYGTAGSGVTVHSFFGSQSPQMITVNCGYKQTMQVPWGMIKFAPLDAMFQLDSTLHPKKGPLFQLTVHTPTKNKKEVEELFRLIEAELEQYSIYRGKYFTGGSDPDFRDPYAVDRSQIVYTDEVETQLGANLWAMMEHPEAVKKQGVPFKRAVLLSGTYGTGKSVAGLLTAQIANANGWTFIACRPGEDSLEQVLQTAKLYQPAVVFYEDMDQLSSNDPEIISKVLEMFDGVSSKGVELAMLLTTNYPEEIIQPLLRAGRIDALVEVGSLDHDAFIRLIKVLVGDVLDPDIDFDQVADAMADFEPSYVKSAVDRAKLYAVWRAKGDVELLTTDDFVHAARQVRPQRDRMLAASRKITVPMVEEALKKVVSESVTSGDVAIVDKDQIQRFTLGTAR